MSRFDTVGLHWVDTSPPRIVSGVYRVVVTQFGKLPLWSANDQTPIEYMTTVHSMIILGPLAGQTISDSYRNNHADKRIREEENWRLMCLMASIGMFDPNDQPRALEGLPYEIAVVTVADKITVTNCRAMYGEWFMPVPDDYTQSPHVRRADYVLKSEIPPLPSWVK